MPLFITDKVLDYFEANPNKIITHQELYETIWEVPMYPGYLSILRVTIHKCRVLLDVGCAIHSIRDKGYIYIQEE